MTSAKNRKTMCHACGHRTLQKNGRYKKCTMCGYVNVTEDYEITPVQRRDLSKW